MVTMKKTESDTVEGIVYAWHTLNGTDYGTGYTFNNDEYAICSDGTILDCDGCPLVDGDFEIIAVQNTISKDRAQ